MEMEPDFQLSKMPYDVLLDVSNNLDSEDVLFGISLASSRLHKTLADEGYWKSRFKARYPFLFESSEAYQSEKQASATLCDSSSIFWKKRCFYREKILKSFDGKDRMKQATSKMRVSTWANEAMDGYFDSEEEFEYVDFSCMTFCNNGKTLVAADCHQNFLNYWNVGCCDPDGDPQLPAPSIIRDLHGDLDTTGELICSLKSLDNRVSTGASDGTIVITDLEKQAPAATLRSKERILSHVWKPNLIVAGTFGGSIEVYDERGPGPVFTKKDVMDGAELFDGIEVDLSEANQIVATGWIGESRSIKLVELRTGETLGETTVPDIVIPPPGGHWGQRVRRRACMQVSENTLWFGAESGKILEYDLKSLSLLRDLTLQLGHERHIAGLHHAYGYVVSISHGGRGASNPFYRTTIHDLGKPHPELIWEHNQSSMTGGLSSMAFYPERCFLAVALTNEVKIWRPQ